MALITDIFKYFAKFPTTKAVELNFRTAKSKITGYDQLKTAVAAIPEKELFPELVHFFVETNLEQFKEKFKTLNGFALNVEYGDITETRNTAGIRDTYIKLALTVAFPFNATNNDAAEELLIADSCLDLLNKIITRLEADNHNVCPFKKYISFPATILPIDKTTLAGCCGWVATFQRDNI